jgi:myo-inositol 2-dehydrogenase / D-chiro-inositol 1-dehydrogenase
VVGIGLTGTGWVADVHARALARVPAARLVAVASRDRARGEAFVKKYGMLRVHADHTALLADPEVDVICVGLPNDRHHRVVLDAAAAGKHVICEKPLATSLARGREMVAACRNAGVMLAIAEQLCFAPKLVRARDLVQAGELGRVFRVFQRHQHGGPHSRWFFERSAAGGGVLMDMGCHSIEVARWVLGRPPARAVYARLSNQIHPDSELEDHCTLLVEFEGGAVALLEPSWALRGGMESQLELFGTEGALYVDLMRGTGMRLYADAAPAWSTPDSDWLHTHGYVQSMAHFVECAASGARPLTSGEDGLAQLEVIEAAYASAASGERVQIPFEAAPVEQAVDRWLGPRTGG